MDTASTDDTTEGLTAAGEASRFPLAIRSQRVLQIALGLFWILDAALQFQPFMFGRGFVTSFILPNAQGQPFVLGDFITHIGNFLSPDIAVWNTLFALIQLFIGAGLLFRRTVRPALAVSFVWVLGVWVIGEGLGMVLTGTATALTGAPGSVLMYGLLGLMAWPRQTRRDRDGSDRPVGVASSAAAQGIGRSITPLAVWAGYWCLAAVLFVLPDNRTTTSVQSAVVGMADGQPNWYASFLTHLGNVFSTSGTETAWILALISVVIGLGPLVARRPGWFLAAGAVASFLWWIAGQGLVGNVFSGSATDPNTGPLVILLAAAMVPTVLAARGDWRAPAAEIVRRNPAAAGLGIAALGAALALSASYPSAAPESATSAMSGMTMDASGGDAMAGSATQSATASTCHPHQTGLKIAGLDLANTPYMIMGGTNGMDMNGADASAAAGFNTTTPNWHYTGPALPQAEAQVLLSDGNNGPNDIAMAENGCAPRLTAAQDIGAQQYVQQTSAAVAPYATPAAAMAAGYVPVSPTDYPVVYYVNPDVVAANEAARRTLDPAYVDGLVYATTPSGQQVLAAAMYIIPSTVTDAPMPFGALVQWHRRTQVCGPGAATASSGRSSTGSSIGSSTGTTSSLTITGSPPCPSGSVLQPTPYLSMVWQVPVAGGPLAIQPPDIQIVEAATMQSLGTAGRQ